MSEFNNPDFSGLPTTNILAREIKSPNTPESLQEIAERIRRLENFNPAAIGQHSALFKKMYGFD